MKVYDDKKIIGQANTEQDAAAFAINHLYEQSKAGKVKDVLVIARIDDDEPGPMGLPQNIINYTSVDTEYEATAFFRLATDMLFHKLGKIIERNTVNEIKKAFANKQNREG